MGNVIVHIDLNAFFVRCEEIKDPTLINKPVAIGHEGRCGIVSTCSYEARKYGVSSGMPMFKATALCPNLIIKPVDFHYYQSLSQQFIKFVKSYTNLVEIASIDEVYADFTNNLKNVTSVVSYFRDFQNKLYQKTQLKCSIGIASTKFLAKMGSDYKKPLGLTIIRKRDISNILFPQPIENLFGIGKKTAPKLKQIGIKTIGELKTQLDNNNPRVYELLGKFTETINLWLEGGGENTISIEKEDAKSIGNSMTLYQDTDSPDEIYNALSILAKEVSERAKKERKIGTTIQLVVKDNEFKSFNKSISFKNPTNDFDFILATAYQLYERNFTDKVVRLVGVTLQNLINPEDSVIQMTFYDYEFHEEENKTKLLINDFNRKLKKPLLKRASEVKK